MKKAIALFFLIIISLGVIGCKNKDLANPKTDPVVDSFVENNNEIKKEINKTQEEINKETKVVLKETKNIDENIEIIKENSNNLELNFNELQNIVPELMELTNNDEEIMSLIYRSIETIKKSAENINQSNDSIEQSNEAIIAERQELLKILKSIENNNKRVERIQEDIKEKDKIIESKDKKIDQLEDQAEQASTKYLGMLVAFGAVIMVLGVLGFFYNFRVGIIMLGIGGITVSITAATMYYMGWFAIIGLVTMGVGLLLLVTYLAWTLFRGRTFAKATEENAELIETIKQELPESKKYEIFGDRIRPGLAQMMQSKSTQKEIDRIRRKVIKPKMENTIGPKSNSELVFMDGVAYQKVGIAPNNNKNV